jgi:hypothetical protein
MICIAKIAALTQNTSNIKIKTSIPANKTLLRRHLNTHFIALVGNDTQHKKREHESQPSYIPLLPNAKVKVS